MIASYEAGEFPSLNKPDAQMAIVQLVEREGFSAMIAEVFAEESASSTEEQMAAAGFRALMKVVEQGSAQIEEVMTHIEPEDFFWEVCLFPDLKQSKRK